VTDLVIAIVGYGPVLAVEGREPEDLGPCGWTQPGAPCFDPTDGTFYPEGKP
jgi:hypothetical protein